MSRVHALVLVGYLLVALTLVVLSGRDGAALFGLGGFILGCTLSQAAP